MEGYLLVLGMLLVSIIVAVVVTRALCRSFCKHGSVGGCYQLDCDKKLGRK